MRLIAETGQNFSGFLGARLLFVTVLLGVSFVFRVDNQSVIPHLMLFSANVALSLGCWEWYKKSTNSKSLLWFTAITSVVLDTILLRDIGGSNSEFVYLYFFYDWCICAVYRTLRITDGSLFICLRYNLSARNKVVAC